MYSFESRGLPLMSFKRLGSIPGIFHFVTTRKGGFSEGRYYSLNFGSSSGDNPVFVEKNFARLAEAIGIEQDKMILMDQVHGDNIGFIDKKGDVPVSAVFAETDAVISTISNYCLLVKCADCVPLLFFDRVKKVVAVAHAGWRGTVASIAVKVIRKMQSECGSDPANIMVAIGPSIGPDSFIVGEEVVEVFNNTFPEFFNRIAFNDNGQWHINLWETNKLQLRAIGVKSKHIEVAGICTVKNHHRFFSHRAEAGNTGRFVAGIVLL